MIFAYAVFPYSPALAVLLSGLTNCFFLTLFDIPTCKVARVQFVEFLGTNGRKTGHVFLFSTVFVGCVSFFRRRRHSYVYYKKEFGVSLWESLSVETRLQVGRTRLGGRVRTRVPRLREEEGTVTLGAFSPSALRMKRVYRTRLVVSIAVVFER